MSTFKLWVGASAAVVMACAPLATAAAHGHGYRHFHGWGVGTDLLGAVVGIVTLPLVIASAAIEASLPAAPGYWPATENYAPSRPYYPQRTYAPPAYYPRAPAYYPAPRAYYAPRAYSPPRSGYYGGYGPYRPGGYAYSNP